MPEKVIEILKSVDAVMTGDHFVLTSGKHCSIYINKDGLYPHVRETSQVCRLMAEKCSDFDVETVAAPSLGGIILSQWTAYYLSEIKNKAIKSVYAEKDGEGGFQFTRGYDEYIRNKKVLVLEDLTSTGGSVKKVVDVVREYGGEVQAVCVMVNRNPKGVNSEMFNAPFLSLGELEVPAYDENEMPQELKQRPVNTEVGHGAEYLAKQKGAV